MRIVGRILLGILALALVLTLGAYTLPRHPKVFRAVEIAAPPATVYAIVNDLRRFNEWSPWVELDPAAEYTFTGPVDGVGQTMNWQSANPNVGTGSQTIARLEPEKAVAVSLDFGAMGPAEATINLEPTAAGTLVTWGFSTDLGFNPIGRYMGVMFDGWIGGDYERGLAKLKTVAEATPTIAPSADAAPSASPAPTPAPAP
jgi:uncharacterized protein YndB with AHSA1/START domain